MLKVSLTEFSHVIFLSFSIKKRFFDVNTAPFIGAETPPDWAQLDLNRNVSTKFKYELLYRLGTNTY